MAIYFIEVVNEDDDNNNELPSRLERRMDKVHVALMISLFLVFFIFLCTLGLAFFVYLTEEKVYTVRKAISLEKKV